MFINLNKDGTIAKVIGSRVFRKSNSVSTIALFAPFAKDASIKINYTLPDGSVFSDVMLYQEFSQDEEKNLFTCKVTHSITEIEGQVIVSLEIHATNGDDVEIQTTAETYITVEASTSNDLALPAEEVFMNAVNGVNAQAQTNKEDITLLNEHITGSDTTITTYMTNTDQAIADLQQAEQDHETRLQNKVKSISVDTTTDIPKIHYENETQQFNIDIKGFVIDASYNATTGVVTLNTSGEDIPDITFDLPTELRFESGRYVEATKDLIMVLANGSEIAIPVDDIFKPISDLETRATNIELKNTTQDNRLSAIEGAYLKKDGSVEMNENYQPTTPKQVANKDYVDKSILAVTGQDLSNLVTPAQLDEAVNEVKAELDDPTFVEETFDKSVNTPANKILEAPQELVSIEGNTLPILTASEQAIADIKVSDTHKNTVVDEECPRLNEKLRQKVYDGSENWKLFPDGELANTIMFTNSQISESEQFTTQNTKDNYGIDCYNDETYDDNESIWVRGYAVRINKSRLIDKGLTVDVDGFKQLLQIEPLIITYTLTVENPFEKPIDDADVNSVFTGYVNVDAIQIIKPYDSIMFNDTTHRGVMSLEGYAEGIYAERDNISSIDKFYSEVNASYIMLMVAKDTTLQQARDSLRGKKLTYQLAQPRILDTRLENVENPTTKIVVKNLFDGVLIEENINMNGSFSATSGYVRNQNPIIIKSSQDIYIKVDTQVPNFVIAQYDEDMTLLDRRILFNNLDNGMFTTVENVKYIYFKFGDGISETTNHKIMVSYQDIPYESYEESKRVYAGIFPEYTKIVGNKKETGGKLIKLWEETFTLHATLTNVYRFQINNFVPDNLLLPNGLSKINTFPYIRDFMGDVRHYYYESTTLWLYIEKSIIDDITYATTTTEERTLFSLVDSLTLVHKLKVYLYRIKGQFIGQSASVTEEDIVPTESWLGDNPVFDSNSTIYQESDTPVLPVLTFNCTLDTSAQIVALCESREKLLSEIDKMKQGTTVVKEASNSSKLNNQDASYYAKQSDVTTNTTNTQTNANDISNIKDGTTAVGNSSKLNNQDASYYAKQSDVETNATNIATNDDDIAKIRSGEYQVGDSFKLNDQLSSYYAKQSDVDNNTTNISNKIDKYVDLWISPESYGQSCNELTETTFALSSDISNFRYLEIVWTWGSGFDQVFKHVSKVTVPIEISANAYSISCFGGLLRLIIFLQLL
ncbi:hypothetical protein KHQ81_12820 [Mycoplasmatota bacterium]|nr:hypothetical protein KHQ81_12820 [Mycoplasmatota bacterium]